METNLDARRIIAKIGCAALVWVGAAVALALIDAFLGPAGGEFRTWAFFVARAI